MYRAVGVAGVEGLARDPFGRLVDEIDVQIRQIVDVNVGPRLRAAEHQDLPPVHGMIC